MVIVCALSGQNLFLWKWEIVTGLIFKPANCGQIPDCVSDVRILKLRPSALLPVEYSTKHVPFRDPALIRLYKVTSRKEHFGGKFGLVGIHPNEQVDNSLNYPVPKAKLLQVSLTG